MTHKAILDELRQPVKDLHDHIPALLESDRALSSAVTRRCDGCMASHARSAARRGATAVEVADALGVAILMNGGPGTVHAPRDLQAFQEFAR